MKELQVSTIGNAFEELTTEEMLMDQGGGEDMEIYSTITMPVTTAIVTTLAVYTAWNDCF